MIILSNDDGKKMVERDGLDSFLEEYAYVTGVELTLIAAGDVHRSVSLKCEV